MNLRWTQRFDGNSIITGFDIEYKNKSGGLWAGPATATWATCSACAPLVEQPLGLRAAYLKQTRQPPPVHKPRWLPKGRILVRLGTWGKTEGPPADGEGVSPPSFQDCSWTKVHRVV